MLLPAPPDLPLELEEEGLLSGPDMPLEPVRYHEFQAVDPTRQLNWRMRRARWLARRKRDGDPRYDDTETLRALRYLRAKRDDNTEEGFADIELAEEIHNGNKARRLEIQARLLARQTPEQVAKQLGLSAKAVVAYEALFFHIKDRLNATHWIIKRAIKGRVFSQSRESQPDVTAKSFAYFGGVRIAELVLPFLLHNTGPLTEPVRLDTAEGRTMEKARLAILIQSLPSDAQTNRRLAMAYSDFLGLLKPIQKPVLHGVAVGLMSPLPGSLTKSLRKEVTDNTIRNLEAVHEEHETVRGVLVPMKVA